MTVLAIVVTFNGKLWIDKCFGSLVQSNFPVKILAIDNHSTDGTPEIIRHHFPQVEVIESPHNLGFGQANNIGIKRAIAERADCVFLLNQDAWVEPETLETLVDLQKRFPQYGILSPLEYFQKGVLDIKFRTFYAPEPLLLDIEKKQVAEEPYETGFVNAAGWLISKEVISTVGGFDPIFTHYGEDVDYCKRVQRSGKFIGISGLTRYFHDRPQQLNKESSVAKQMHHNHLSRVLYARWGTGHPLKRLLVSNLIYLKDLIKSQAGARKQGWKSWVFFWKNAYRIFNPK